MIAVCLLRVLPLAGQNKADDIIGYYYCVDPFSNEASQNYIYKNPDGSFSGKIVWVANPKFKDYINHVFLTGLKYNAKDNEWAEGTLTYPGKSGTFKTYMSFASSTQLKVRGYWGVAVLGKTMYWTKENSKR